jgi:hypothetical protein
MPNFAIVENGIVTNIILADSKAIAEEVTGKTCVAYTTEPAEIGGTYVNKKFIKRKPYPSWVSDGDVDWKAPINMPAFDEAHPKYYTWDESKIDWVEITV